MNSINSIYLDQIKNIPLLSREEETKIAEKAFAGDKEAQKKLVSSNLRLVIKIAGKYSSFMEIDDLIDEGNIGLMTAAQKFDPSNGAKFSTYAVWWIREYMQKAIRETSTGVKFPSSRYEDMYKDMWKFASLDKPVESRDEGDTLGSLLIDEQITDPFEEFYRNEMESQAVTYAQTVLEGKERDVINLRYGLTGRKPMSLAETGEAMGGYSKERIRQVEVRALRKLRMNLSFDLEQFQAA